MVSENEAAKMLVGFKNEENEGKKVFEGLANMNGEKTWRWVEVRLVQGMVWARVPSPDLHLWDRTGERPEKNRVESVGQGLVHERNDSTQ